MFKPIPFALALLSMSASAALAANAGGGGAMPWDAPLTAIQTDLSGTTATAISLIALVAVFGVLIFGGELNHFARTLCFIVMAAAMLVGGNGVFAALGIAGASVAGSSDGFDVGVLIVAVIICIACMRVLRHLAAPPSPAA
jgi:type IV secretion system protein VirB2